MNSRDSAIERETIRIFAFGTAARPPWGIFPTEFFALADYGWYIPPFRSITGSPGRHTRYFDKFYAFYCRQGYRDELERSGMVVFSFPRLSGRDKLDSEHTGGGILEGGRKGRDFG